MLSIRKSHGPTNRGRQNVLLYHPVIAVGTTSKFASPRKGPYVIEKCLNDVTFRSKEEDSSKQQMVHYARLNLFFKPPPTSNVSSRNKQKNFQSTQDRADTHKYTDGTLNHDECQSFLPEPSTVFTPVPAVERTAASTRTSRITPITSSSTARREVTISPPVVSQLPPLEQLSPNTRNDVAIPSPTTPHIDKQPLIPENAFLYEKQSPRDNVTEIVDAAARDLRGTPRANTSQMQLRPKTSSHGKSQPLFTSYLLDIVTSCNSPERETQKQSGTQFKKTPKGKRKLIIKNNEDLFSGS